MLHLTDAHLYLPLAEEQLRSVLDETQPFEDALSELDVPQLAALVVIQCLAKGPLPHPPGTMLAETIALGNRWVRQAGLPAFLGQMAAAVSRAGLHAGQAQLAAHGVALVAPEDLEPRSYLSAEGEWDPSFTLRHRENLFSRVRQVVLQDSTTHTLTPQQSGVYREVEADSEAHLHVQGYAGIGKSHLITALLSMLVSRGAVIALVAERRVQLEALRSRIGTVEGVHPLTFEGLIDEVVPPDLTNPAARRMRQRDRAQATVSDETLARQLGLHARGGQSPAGLARIIRGTVSAFCRSGEPEIDSVHIPRYAPLLDATTRLLVLHHATELWKAVVQPASREFQPPVHDYHRLKWAALNGCGVPGRYTHVLMDEAHDLPSTLLQIVENGRQAVITLGDEYQNLQARPLYRASKVRQRELTVSVRSGRSIETIVNPLIAVHPGQTKLPFQGTPSRELEVRYYERPELPATPLLVLVNDEWGLFEWSQRLGGQGPFTLLSNARRLDMFVNDCIELHRSGVRPRHGAIFRHGSWESLSAAYHDNSGFQRIDRMLAKGYARKDWEKTLERARGTGHQLALVEDVRNREFPDVMLAPDVVEWAWRARQTSRAEAASVIYVAVTRAQRTLHLPRRLQAWIADLAPPPATAAVARGPTGAGRS